ncbi:MAG: hypothetical protein AAGI91_08745 [Bacteroidota bacterium]
MPDRRFTEDEVREIVRRASEQQAEDAERREAREHGLTLTDLERLGAEVGLEPDYLRRAADEVRTGRRNAAETETRTDTHVVVERRIDAPFTPEAWEDTVNLLRQRFGLSGGSMYGQGTSGDVQRVGRAHEWSHTSSLGVQTLISVSEREGGLRLLLSQRVGTASPKVEGIAYAAVIGLVLGVIAAAFALKATGSTAMFFLTLLGITGVMTGAGAPVVTRLDKGWREKKMSGLKEIASDIGQVFQDAARSSAAGQHTETDQESAPVGQRARASEPQLDLDALPDEEERTGAAERRRTRS